MSLITFDLPFNASNLYHNSNGNLNEISGGGGALTLEQVLTNGNDTGGLPVTAIASNLILFTDGTFQADFSELVWSSNAIPVMLKGSGNSLTLLGSSNPNGLSFSINDDTNAIHVNNTLGDVSFSFNSATVDNTVAFFLECGLRKFKLDNVGSVVVNNNSGFTGTLADAISSGKAVVHGLIVN